MREVQGRPGALVPGQLTLDNARLGTSSARLGELRITSTPMVAEKRRHSNAVPMLSQMRLEKGPLLDLSKEYHVEFARLFAHDRCTQSLPFNDDDAAMVGVG